MSDSLSVIFAGTPDFAAHHLQALLDSPHRVVAVYTQPDRPAGRGKKLQLSPVKQLALAQGLPVYQPVNFKAEEDRQQLAVLGADIMVVVAYGLLLPQSVLDIPRLGCINVHASLLPRWRGAAPIQRAIEAGDKATGVTIMQMEKGLDTGPMLNKVTTLVSADETGGSLHDKLQEVGAPALVATLDQLLAGTAVAEPQDDSQTCYAAKIEKPDLNLNWQESASVLSRRIRAFNPFPVCFTFLGNDRLKIFDASAEDSAQNQPPGTILAATRQGIRVACGEGELNITRLQIPGKKPMTVEQLVNGYAERFIAGSRMHDGN